jgi:hypothetical protein
MEDPSLLDYFKSLFRLKNRSEDNHLELFPQLREPHGSLIKKKRSKIFPFKLIVAFIFGIIAQFLLEPPNTHILVASILYFFASVLCFLEITHSSFDQKPDKFEKNYPSVRMISFVFSLLLVLIAFWTFSDNRFTAVNLTIWILALALFIYSAWQKMPQKFIKNSE